QRIADAHLRDVRSDLLGLGAAIALVAELHVRGRDRVPVVEPEIAPKLELIHEPVSALGPRLGEARGHLALARQGPHQGVVEREEYPERGDLRRSGRWIEPGRGNRDAPRD